MSAQTGTRLSRKRLARYKRRKDNANTAEQFLKWSIRYHTLFNRMFRSQRIWL